MGVRFNRRQCLDVGVLASVNFGCGLCISLQAPIFPREAERKGASATEYGLVFGVFELVTFISCPIYGKYLDKIGANKTLNCGILLAGISVICFGLLDLIDSHAAFISLAFVLRILEALGTSAAITASYSVTAAVFPDYIATTFAIMKGFFGIGFMIGPAIGGYTFELGGFVTTFVVIGCFLIVDAIVVCAVLPNIVDDRTKKETPIQIFMVLRQLPVFLDMISIVVNAIAAGFILATLEPHIRQFGLSPVATGAVFMIEAGTYALCTLVVGYLCDRINPKKIIIFGAVIIIAGICLIGPAPYLPVDTILWVVCVGLAFQGLGNACILVAGLVDALSSAVACGIPNDMALYGVVSGLAQSGFALGDTIGPSVGGLLCDTVGFRQGTLFLMGLLLIVVIAMTTLVCVEQRRTQKPNKSAAQAFSVGTCAERTNDECALLASMSTKNDYGS